MQLGLFTSKSNFMPRTWEMAYPNAPKEMELKILGFIKGYYSANGRPPTFKEIQLNFEFKSPRSVSYYVEKLLCKGMLKNLGNSRGLFATTLEEHTLIYQQNQLKEDK